MSTQQLNIINHVIINIPGLSNIPFLRDLYSDSDCFYLGIIRFD